MIRLENITKKYQNQKEDMIILNNVSLNINKGEMVGIMGPSGSGKTTLINIIGMLDYYQEGKYFFNEKEIDNSNLFKLNKYRGKNIGFVVQDFALLDDLTVKENFELILDKKLKKEEYIKKLKLVALDESYLNRYPKELSGGQCQRVAIARSLLLNPEVIIADEPTGALDFKTSKKIMQIFKYLKELGKTIIIVTHDVDVAKECEKIYVLKDKNIVAINRKG